MKKSNIKTGLACLLVLGLTTGYAAAQGSLTPTEAPAPTMKTLEQVEPRTDLATVVSGSGYHHIISAPGSYYLSANLEVTTTSGGIYIDAPGVTLDLNGFRISRASGTGNYGIYISSTGDGATVRNGSITGFPTGIYSQGTAVGCLFEKLSVSVCSTYGIYAGASSRIIDCRAFNNPGSGIDAYTASTLSGCSAYNNQGAYGIHAGGGSTLSGCTAYENQGIGIYAGNGANLSDCSAYGNQESYGIYAGSGSALSDCSAYGNQGSYGIYAGSGSALSGCSARNNVGKGSSSYGIYAPGSTVVGCTAAYNSNTNSPGTSSQGIGIHAGVSGAVKDCTATNNKGDGIRVDNDCTVSGNTCDGNGYNGDGAGIHTTVGDNRIEGNNVTDNDRGIDTDVAGNLIIRNSAAWNGTNYDITGTQTIGPIITATGTITTVNPWANFSF